MRQRLADGRRVTSNVRAVVRSQGRTYTWLARQCGIHPTYLQKMENGEKPLLPRYIEGASKALGVMESLLFVVEQPADDLAACS